LEKNDNYLPRESTLHKTKEEYVEADSESGRKNRHLSYGFFGERPYRVAKKCNAIDEQGHVSVPAQKACALGKFFRMYDDEAMSAMFKEGEFAG